MKKLDDDEDKRQGTPRPKPKPTILEYSVVYWWSYWGIFCISCHYVIKQDGNEYCEDCMDAQNRKQIEAIRYIYDYDGNENDVGYKNTRIISLQLLDSTNGEFDVNVYHLKNEWFALYVFVILRRLRVI